MFDSEFDPYHELLAVKHQTLLQQDTINKLVTANNGHDQLLLELTQQHHHLIALIREQREQIAKLTRDLSLIQPKPPENI